MKLIEVISIFLASMKGVKSASTVKWYKQRLNTLASFLGEETAIESITVHQLRMWRGTISDRSTRYTGHPTRAEEAGGLSRITLHGYVRSVRRFFTWLVEEGILKNNPSSRFELPQVERRPKTGISDRDQTIMLEFAKRLSLRDYAILMFVSDTGCRAAGIAGLQLKDLDITRRRATVYEKGRGGNGKGRTVYFLPDTASVLREWLSQRIKDNHGFVFSSAHGGGLTSTGVYLIFKRIAKEAGVKGKWSPHQWRHWRARKWAQGGMNLGIVAQLLGHTDVKVTSEYYGSFADADLQQAHLKYTLTGKIQ